MMKLRALHLQDFRGATRPMTIAFDEAKNFTMIFGENGTGKSSIVDAFSFLCEQTTGSLKERKTANEDYVTAITGDRTNLRVKLEADTGVWEAAFKAKAASIVVTPNTSIPTVRILRRSQILRLIEAEPSKRYQELSNYIELPGISKCEEALRKAAKTATEEYTRATSAQQKAETNINNLWVKEQSPGANAEEWAKGEAAKDVTALATGKKTADDIGSKLDELDRKRTAWQKKSVTLKTAGEAVVAAEAALKAAESASEGAGSLVELLREAKAFVDGQTVLSSCPVCEKPVGKEELSVALAARITAMDSIARLSKACRDARKTLDQAKSSANEASTSYVSELRKVATTLRDSTLEPIKKATLPAAELAKLVEATTPEADCLAMESSLAAKVPTLKTALEQAKAEWSKTIDAHNAITTYLDDLVQSRKKAAQTEELNKRTKLAVELVEATRKQFVEDELRSIGSEVDWLYEALHPDEKLGGIKLSLDPQFKQSLNLTAKFHTESDITPQSLYSESHLDTLGFAVFFAMAKKYQTDGSLIILDDVVTSVDENHLDRFIRLLHDEAGNFAHVLITTHYRPWRDRYKQHRAPGGNMHFIELRSWSMETGIRTYCAKSMTQELRDALAANDFNRRDISNTAGLLMENILDWLTVRYACRLARKADPLYTLKELADAVSQKELVKVLRVQRLKDGTTDKWDEHFLKERVEAIKQLSAVRNQVGCHYNFDGSLVSDGDVEEFGKASLGLAELLCCPNNGDLPDRDKTGECWETRSRLVKLYPLRTPVNA
jgi:ABC-type transport system involved in cytochrome c biogenesis ATPase subunit